MQQLPGLDFSANDPHSSKAEWTPASAPAPDRASAHGWNRNRSGRKIDGDESDDEDISGFIRVILLNPLLTSAAPTPYPLSAFQLHIAVR
jgi:hypothetical protein